MSTLRSENGVIDNLIDPPFQLDAQLLELLSSAHSLFV